VSDRNAFLVCKVLLASSALLLLAGGAHAYVGPGAGLELVGYSMSLLAWVAVAFSALFLYPFYSFLRWLRGDRAGAAAAAPAPGVLPTAAQAGAARSVP
jgi:hypothetical protein